VSRCTPGSHITGLDVVVNHRAWRKLSSTQTAAMIRLNWFILPRVQFGTVLFVCRRNFNTPPLLPGVVHATCSWKDIRKIWDSCALSVLETDALKQYNTPCPILLAARMYSFCESSDTSPPFLYKVWGRRAESRTVLS